MISPLTQQAPESKTARRKRLMALPYPGKVRIVKQMRDAARRMKTADQAGAKQRRTETT